MSNLGKLIGDIYVLNPVTNPSQMKAFHDEVVVGNYKKYIAIAANSRKYKWDDVENIHKICDTDFAYNSQYIEPVAKEVEITIPPAENLIEFTEPITEVLFDNKTDEFNTSDNLELLEATKIEKNIPDNSLDSLINEIKELYGFEVFLRKI